MLRRIARDLRVRDDGLSVLEVVLAAFILFFVFTATLGLVGTTTRMNVDGKARVAMTNAVSSHMEYVRSLSFDEIAIVGTTPEGVVQPQQTVTVDGFQITINNQISTGQGGTKELQVTATASAPGQPTVSMTAFAAVRDSANGLNLDIIGEDPNAPEVVFTSMTPDEEEVVYGSYKLGGSALHVEAEATAKNAGGSIVEMRYYCGGELLRDGSTIFADVAEWQPGTSPARELFRWDTRQVNDEGDPVIQDGWRIIYVIAVDETGAEGRAERRLYVDNHAPDVPGTMEAEVQSDTETRVSWGIAQDGTDAAAKYEVGLFRIDGNTAESQGTFIVDDPVYPHIGTPFSRYTAAVRAGSPRNLWSEWVDMDAPYTTRPVATGSSTTWYEGRNNSRKSYTDVSLYVMPPNFDHSHVQYDLYRSMDPTNLGGAPYASDTGTAFNENVMKAVGKRGTPDPFYYQWKVTYVATGPGGGQTETVWSDVIGPTTANEATEPMEHVSW